MQIGKKAAGGVDDQIINNEVKGAINDRLRSELFDELGLELDHVIVPGPPLALETSDANVVRYQAATR